MTIQTKNDVELRTLAAVRGLLKESQARLDAVIRCQADKFASRSLSGSPEPQITQVDKAAYARAQVLLNGHAHILPALRESSGDQELATERRALELIIVALRREETQAEAIEGLAFAEQHASTWRAIAREWFIAAARFDAIERQAREFRSHPLANYMTIECGEYVGAGAEIDIPRVNLEIALKDAYQQGVVTSSDLKGARRV